MDAKSSTSRTSSTAGKVTYRYFSCSPMDRAGYTEKRGDACASRDAAQNAAPFLCRVCCCAVKLLTAPRQTVIPEAERSLSFTSLNAKSKLVLDKRLASEVSRVCERLCEQARPLAWKRKRRVRSVACVSEVLGRLRCSALADASPLSRLAREEISSASFFAAISKQGHDAEGAGFGSAVPLRPLSVKKKKSKGKARERSCFVGFVVSYPRCARFVQF